SAALPPFPPADNIGHDRGQIRLRPRLRFPGFLPGVVRWRRALAFRLRAALSPVPQPPAGPILRCCREHPLPETSTRLCYHPPPRPQLPRREKDGSPPLVWPRARGYTTNSSSSPPRLIFPSASSLRATATVSCCALIMSRERTGPSTSISSFSI